MKQEFSRVHPDLRPIALRTPAFLFSRNTLWLTKLFTRLIPPSRPPEDIVVQNRSFLSGDDQQKTRVRIFRPKFVNAPTPVLVWMHGGGYMMGKPEMDDWRCTVMPASRASRWFPSTIAWHQNIPSRRG